MNVVLLTADYPPHAWSGVGVAVHQQAIDLAALGARVRVIVVGCGQRAVRDSNPEVLMMKGEAVPEAVGSAEWVHLQSLALTELAIELRRKTGAKLAYTVHTQPWLELADHPQRRFWLDMQTRLLGECDRVVFLSAAEQTLAEALFPSLRTAHLIPNGVPPPSAVLPGRANRDVVLFAGRFALSKGVDILAQCIGRLRRVSDLRFMIVGGHGDRRGTEVIQRIVREHGDACELTGWLSHEELGVRLARSLVVLIPSRYEPFGLIALEAMRMGAPLLAMNVGGLRDTVRPGSGGLLLDSPDPRRWADATLRVTRDAALWERLHTDGPQFVGSHYRSSFTAERLLREVYC